MSTICACLVLARCRFTSKSPPFMMMSDDVKTARAYSHNSASSEGWWNNAWPTFAVLSFEYLAVSLLFLWFTLFYVTFIYFSFRHLDWCVNNERLATGQEYLNDPNTEINKAILYWAQWLAWFEKDFSWLVQTAAFYVCPNQDTHNRCSAKT